MALQSEALSTVVTDILVVRYISSWLMFGQEAEGMYFLQHMVMCPSCMVPWSFLDTPPSTTLLHDIIYPYVFQTRLKVESSTLVTMLSAEHSTELGT